MRLLLLFFSFICFMTIACKKPNDRPKSKTDYIPIVSANTPKQVLLGQPIQSRVRCGFSEYFADIKFLNFEAKQISMRQYEIRAKGFYNNIIYDYSLPVLMIFDTTFTLQTSIVGQYLLKFYSFNQLVETDTVQVNF